MATRSTTGRPNLPGRVLFSSVQSPWSGFELESATGPEGYAGDLLFLQPAVVLVSKGTARVVDHTLAARREFVAEPGTLSVWPGSPEPRRLVSTGSVDAIRIHVTWSTIQRLAPLDEPLAGIFIEPRGGFHDPQIAALVRSMHAEVMAGCPAGRLYGESLSLALAARLVAQHGAPSDRRPESPGGLSRRQFNQVIEYVRANLGSELSLANLADAAQLSPNGFGRAFRNAAGFSPHQLVLRERLREAARLLAEAELPIARIAQVLGFSSQSHFTEVFRKASGTTPRRYQQEL